jgi:hypothetical protein
MKKIIAGDWRNLPAMIFYLMKNRPRCAQAWQPSTS